MTKTDYSTTLRPWWRRRPMATQSPRDGERLLARTLEILLAVVAAAIALGLAA